MAEGVFVALNLLIYLAILISGLLWLQFLSSKRFGFSPFFDPRLAVIPRRRPFWTAASFLVMFGIFFLTTALLAGFALSQGWMSLPSDANDEMATAVPVDTTEEMNASSGSKHAIAAGDSTDSIDVEVGISMAAGSIAFAVMLALLVSIRKDKKRAIIELGLTFNRERVRQGLIGSLWLLPPVAMISLLVSILVPYEHKVLDILQSIADQPSMQALAILFLGTVIVTPLVEEFMFRVLLQGGLQGMVDGNETEEFDSWRPTSWWPIVVTSVLFAMIHFGQGAAPIPLFFLSLGLGYLYRQTGSVIPPMIVHMVLNGTTIVAEFTRLLAE